MAYDMTNALMEAFILYLPDYLNEGLIDTNDIFLETIEKGPLQDDPTKRASFLVIEPDMDADPDGYRQPVGIQRRNKLHVADSAPQYEVGGGFLMINYFKISGWTPRASTKAVAYTNIGKHTRRLERGIQRMARRVLPDGIATDDETESTFGLLNVFNLNGTIFKLVGGENEWYGKVYVSFAVYSRIDNEYWK
jgi:hypothetical protein